VVLLAKGLKSAVELRRTLLLLSGAFLAFSVSDLIESHTGAWWRPIWLLVLKAACIAVFLFGFRHYYRLVKANKTAKPDL